MKLGTYIMGTEPISRAYLKNSPQKSVCLFFLRLGKHIPNTTNTCNSRQIVGCVIFYAVHALLKERLWIPLSLLGNNSVKPFLWQWRIVGGVVFCVPCRIKGNRQLVLPRSSCTSLYYEPVSFPTLVGKMYWVSKVSSYTMDGRLFLRQKQQKLRSSSPCPEWFQGSSCFTVNESSWKNIWSPAPADSWERMPCNCAIHKTTRLCCKVLCKRLTSCYGLLLIVAFSSHLLGADNNT
jgi:hypothetical protein